MCNKVKAVNILLLAGIPFFISCGASHEIKSGGEKVLPKTQTEELGGRSLVVKELFKNLTSRHYVERSIDDAFAEEYFSSLLVAFDPDRLLYTEEDIDRLKIHQSNLDNQLRAGSVDTARKIYRVSQDKKVERLNYLIALLGEKGRPLSINSGFQLKLNRDSEPYAKNQQEQLLLWEKFLEWEVICLVADGQSFEAARGRLLKRYQSALFWVEQEDGLAADEIILNVISQLFDSHTEYWSSNKIKLVNESSGDQHEGIGVVFRKKGGDIFIAEVIHGGAAYKNGGLNRGDKLISVAQGEHGDLVDTLEMPLAELLRFVNGPIGSLIRLDVQSEFGQKTLLIERGAALLQDQSVSRKVLDVTRLGKTYKIGVIDLPTFYVDFYAQMRQQKSYRSSASDVAELIKLLMGEEVDGIIVDVRDNGGGSLVEGINVADLFLDEGPLLQIRTSGDRINRHHRSRVKALYRGPLLLLQNRLSGGASEILAAAIQDYQRGIVVGEQSFGNGTIQSVNPLTNGGLKLTESKSYRISGKAFQKRGVVPDIEFPFVYDPEKVGESVYPNILEFDEISAVPFTLWSDPVQQYFQQLKTFHTARLKNSQEFSYLPKRLNYYRASLDGQAVTLDIAYRKNKLNEINSVLGNENEKLKLISEKILSESAQILVDYIKER